MAPGKREPAPATERLRKATHGKRTLLQATRVRVVVEQVGVLDLMGKLPDGDHVNARDVRGERLAHAMVAAMADLPLAPGVDLAAIEEQPGHSMRGPARASDAHSLKMNNMAYVMLTFLACDRRTRVVTLRSTRRKDMAMDLLTKKAAPEPAEETAADPADPADQQDPAVSPLDRAGYDSRKHAENKKRSLAVLRGLLASGGGPVLARCAPGWLKRYPGLAWPSELRLEAPAGFLEEHLTRGKCDDKADATWLAVAAGLERLCMLARPTHVAAADYDANRLSAGASLRVLGMDVGTRHPAFCLLRVTLEIAE